IEDIDYRVGIGPAGLQVERDREILPVDLREIGSRIDGIELTVDIDLLQLVDQQHRRIAVDWQVARGQLDPQAIVRTVAEFRHYLRALGSPLRDVSVIPRHLPQHLQGHAREATGWRLEDAANLALALAQDLDERFAVDRQCHRTPQLEIVERRLVAVDQQ